MGIQPFPKFIRLFFWADNLGDIACDPLESSFDFDGHELIGYSTDIDNIVLILLADHNTNTNPSAAFSFII